MNILLRGILTWIVGFTNDNLHLSQVIGSIPHFVSQAYFTTVNSTPKTISDALILSCASPSLLDHTGIIFMEKSYLSIFASVKEITRSTLHMPCGIPLSHCPTCKNNSHLSSYNFSQDKCDIKCSGCGSEGFSTIPPGHMVVNMDHHLEINSQRYSIGPFPRPTEMTVEWKKSHQTVRPAQKLPQMEEDDFCTLRYITWRFGVEELYICLDSGIFCILLDDQAFKELAFFDFICSFWSIVPSKVKDLLPITEVENTVRYHRLLHSKVTDLLLRSIPQGPGEQRGIQRGGIQRGSLTLLLPWLCRTLYFFEHDPSSRVASSRIRLPSVFLRSRK